MKLLSPSAAHLSRAAEMLLAGEVVAYPTETVYGLAVNPHSEPALARLFRVKGRDDGRPVLLIVDEPARIGGIVAEVSARAQACIDAFWPGPLSLLLPAVEGLPARLLGETGKVCVRCPACDTARALCRAFGGALTSSSANRTGAAPATRAEDIDLEGVALVLDGGALAPSPPSTVYDPDCDIVYREGPVSRESLNQLDFP